jgi:DNA sulfur modification protein DndD
MEITLLGWSALGLRCPDHQVNLCPDNSNKPYHATLVQMPNGTGKTTTLNLLRATISGSAKDWNQDPKRILELRRSGGTTQTGQFIVRLAINGNPLTFELNLNFKDRKVFYRTTFGAGIRDGFHPPPQLRRFLNPEFVSLFVFDGELANNLLDSKQTRAREAIESLFQLSLLKDLAKVFQENWENHVKDAPVTEPKGLTRRKNRLARLQNSLAQIKEEQKRLKADVLALKLQMENAQEEYNTALSKDRDTGDKLKEIRVKLDRAEKVVEHNVRRAIEEMRNPQKLLVDFGSALQNLKANLDQLKLPSSTSREFFEELAEAERCVCGRPMDDENRQAVRDRAMLYLAEDEVGVLNNIKSDIGAYCNENPSAYYQALEEQLSDLTQLIRTRDQIKTEHQSFEDARLAQGDSELQEKKNRLEQVQKDYHVRESRLQEIERSPRTNPSDDTDCLKELERLVTKAENDVAEATDTLRLKNKTEILKNILAEAHRQAREELRKFIIDETNSRITELLSRDPIFLEDIRDCLKLQGKDGASMGQTLSVSYAFLATLFNRSYYRLPFIVDSPAGALDLNVRPEVARLIPLLCNQFVAFTISSERQSFVDVLHKAAKQQVQYLTIYRKTSRTNSLKQSIGLDKVTETVDGVIVNGKNFFDNFDLDKEEV